MDCLADATNQLYCKTIGIGYEGVPQYDTAVPRTIVSQRAERERGIRFLDRHRAADGGASGANRFAVAKAGPRRSDE